ncbi:MAG: acyltransferase [Ferruginibacter sp.]
MRNNTVAEKPHYPILDGLRGVAAIMVVAFHHFEAHAASRFTQIINHGYMAVDFFFLLSGFVIGYAYDDRWSKISIGEFFKRRLVRLQPMVVMGMLIGAVCFYFQDGVLWPGIHEVPVWKVIACMLVGFLMLPLPTSMEIRGWTEMYPLNGPGWSLFFEYIANILYAVIVRRFSKLLLGILVFLSAAALVHYTVTGPTGDVIGGWSLDPAQLRVGFTRVMFPFFGGLLLCRMAKLIHVKNAFFWCSLLTIIALSLPRFGDANSLWKNGLYESIAIIFIFPFIVWLGAGGTVQGKFASRICRFFGDISYPIYITHYPIIYIYTAWVANNKMPLEKALPVTIGSFIGCIVLAYACLKLYDEPVRKWLKKKFMQ